MVRIQGLVLEPVAVIPSVDGQFGGREVHPLFKTFLLHQVKEFVLILNLIQGAFCVHGQMNSVTFHQDHVVNLAGLEILTHDEVPVWWLFVQVMEPREVCAWRCTAG